jgi:hypothetical protein
VPLDLLAARNSVPRGLLLTRLAKRLEEHLALTEEASRWAVDSWALALGVVSEAELKEKQRQREEADALRVEAATRQTPPPSTRQTPSPVAAEPQASKRAAPPSTPPPPPPPTRTRPSPTTLPTQTPRASPPARMAPAPPNVPSTGTTRPPSIDAAPRGGRGRWRGCLVGCLLLILLSVLLGLGVPFVVNLLREEQQQRNLEPPPVQTR